MDVKIMDSRIAIGLKCGEGSKDTDKLNHVR